MAGHRRQKRRDEREEVGGDGGRTSSQLELPRRSSRAGKLLGAQVMILAPAGG